jgi:hypothetical protein
MAVNGEASRKSFQGSNKGVRELIQLGTKNIQAPKKISLIKTCDHSTHDLTLTPLASRLLQPYPFLASRLVNIQSM